MLLLGKKLTSTKAVPASIAVLALMLLAAPGLATPANGGPDELIGATNPAASYCSELGYDYLIEQTPDGERGVCVLPDGSRVDAWDFYRGKVADEYSWGARNGYSTETRVIDHGTFTTEVSVCVDRRGDVVGTTVDLMGLETHRGTGFAPPESVEQPDRWGRDGVERAPSRDLPAYFDWRDSDGVTPVKNQGQCGSCWAFGTVGPLECNIKIKDGVEVDLSEQWLVSCNQEGWGCGGGWWAHDYHLSTTDPCGDAGAVLESVFPYTAADDPCNCPYTHDYFIDAWGYVPGGDIPSPDAIKQAILDYGPVSVGVAVDQNFQDYEGGVFSADTAPEINHGVVLVGWDDSQGTEGIWFLRNSWGPSWGENGYMRIEYGVDFVGYGTAYVDYRDALAINLPDGAPDILTPGETTSFNVQIVELGDSYVPGSGTLHYRYDGGTWQTSALTSLGGELYEATLPSADCSDSPEFYVSADGSSSGEMTDPEDAPTDVYSAFVGELTAIYSQDFESGTGWSVVNDAGLGDGAWERGVPAGGGTRGDPPNDSDGSGQCYLTDNVEGNSDVDGGRTKLLSPAVDVSGADAAVLSFDLWYTNDFGDDPNNDIFNIYFSDDNGTTWVLADSVGRATPLPYGWYERDISIGDHVSLTSQFRARFDASDLGGGSVVEAGLDAFVVSSLSCESTGIDDTSGPRLNVLHQNAPNPFNPRTFIRYELPAARTVSLRIYDSAGRVVRTLVPLQRRSAGTHIIAWNGTDDAGKEVGSGAYFYRLEAGEDVLSRKMILLK
ncbi:MAG: DUF333 domain-containing protein [Candidatus Eisenbacteria bacterium]|nr:DUF333 domain-containing protein [Candidatus Eisenbacteria bacterium]